MSDLPESLFLNPVWHSLLGPHRHLSIDGGDACRYPADVTPFAALAEPSAAAVRHLRELLEPADPVWIVDAGLPHVPEIILEGSLLCLQMVLSPKTALPVPATPAVEIVPLGAANAAEMVALTDVAFPGFFRSGTYKMGSYFGVRAADGLLIAMAGERLRLEGYPEMSGICTHPAHRGKGLARRLIVHLAAIHRRQGHVSWLQVSAANANAIALYRDIGFETARSVMLQRISRADRTNRAG
ncbi:MAG: GNAT family N-acetyltransferase [Steroidobacteraceae bacterium]|jgi:GNAT superfamily N-acetyltransferase